MTPTSDSVIRNGGETTWDLQDSVARIQRGDFTATVKLAQPAAGIELVGGPTTGHILGIHWPTAASAGSRIVESYVRGGDLVASYASTPEWPFKLTLYWRVDFPPVVGGGDWAIDLQVSIQTQLLDTHPHVDVNTPLAPGEILLLNAASGEFLPSAAAEQQTLGEIPHGCLLVRPPAMPQWSYLEMLHPSDWEPVPTLGPQSVLAAEEAGSWSLRQRLFGNYLEKGVIRRGRLRGVLLRRAGDATRGAEYYRQFENAMLPLTT